MNIKEGCALPGEASCQPHAWLAGCSSPWWFAESRCQIMQYGLDAQEGFTGRDRGFSGGLAWVVRDKQS